MGTHIYRILRILAVSVSLGVSAANAQQVVFLDFDTGSDGTIVYSATMRNDIETLMEGHYVDFAVSFTQTEPVSGDFSTVFFNSGGSGGLASKIDFRNTDMNDTAVVNIDGLGLGTDADIVSATAIIGSHELGHLLGLRHGDSYGPPGFGLASSGTPGAGGYLPSYPGPVTADEFNDHIMSSPRSVDSALGDVTTPSWFSERSASKLANNEQGTVQGEGPLSFDALIVPNTIVSGDNAGLGFDVDSFVGAGNVSAAGEIDVFTFTGSTGDLFTFEVISDIIDYRVVDVLDPKVTVLDPGLSPVNYYGTNASNDDEFETVDSIIIDLILPSDGTYTISVESGADALNDTGQYELFGYRFAIANEPPTADANGPYNVDEGASIFLDATGSSDAEDANAALTFEWDLDNDGDYDDAIGDAPTFSAAALDGPELHTVGLRVTDSGGLSDTDSTTVTVDNVAPTANDDGGSGFTTDENTSFTTADVKGNDTDPAVADVLTVTAFDTTDTTGLVSHNGDGTFNYNPNGQFEYLGTGDSATDSFVYTLSDDDGGSNSATVTITINGVNDLPVMVSVSPGSQTVDYSDHIATVTITATDVDSHPLTLSDDAPSDLSTTGSCTAAGEGTSCSWTLDGQVLVPGQNDHEIDFTANDGEADSPCSGVTGTCRHELTVQPEDATVILDDGNAVAVEVLEAEGPSGPFSLSFFAWETNDVSPPVTDDADFSHGGSGKADYGDLNNAHAIMSLVPVGPGGPVSVACSIIEVNPVAAGYDQVLESRCDFDNVPVNVYEVIARVDGLSDTTRYYFGESAEGVFVVFDPSLGFTTGGGWFYWPETYSEDLCGSEYPGDKTNFGFSMKYNKKRKNVLGSLLLMRHELDGQTCLEDTYKVKSNALDDMAIGDVEDNPPYGWAAINGKATFREPGADNTGSNPFLLYVEDHGEQGCSQNPADEFWIEVQTKDGVVLLLLNGPEPADNDPDNEPPLDGHDEPIECGNIIVPHKTGKGKDKGKP